MLKIVVWPGFRPRRAPVVLRGGAFGNVDKLSKVSFRNIEDEEREGTLVVLFERVIDSSSLIDASFAIISATVFENWQCAVRFVIIKKQENRVLDGTSCKSLKYF